MSHAPERRGRLEHTGTYLLPPGFRGRIIHREAARWCSSSDQGLLYCMRSAYNAKYFVYINVTQHRALRSSKEVGRHFIMKIAGLLTNGGDTCSLNALLRYSRDALRDEGFTKIYGFEGGYRGLITDTCRDITSAHIDPSSGGTILLSLRDSPTPSPRDEARMDKLSQGDLAEKEQAKYLKALWDRKLKGALNTLRERHIDVLVVLGGNGTIAATAAFAEEISADANTKCNIICLPRTIDNDVNTCTQHVFDGQIIQTALCPGYPSAAEKVVRAAISLRTTATSTKRIFTLETMGREAGWLALAATLGWAEVVTVPEVNLVSDPEKNEENKEQLKLKEDLPEEEADRLCEIVVEWYKRCANNVIVGVSEGTLKDCEPITSPVTKELFGERKLGGAGDEVARMLKDYIEREGVLEREDRPNVKNGERYPIIERPEVRCQHTDYDPRMGKPSIYDVELAKVLAYQKLRLMLQDGEFGRMPVLGRVVGEEELRERGVELAKAMDIKKVGQMLLPVEPYYDRERFTSTKAFDDFLYKMVGDVPLRSEQVTQLESL